MIDKDNHTVLILEHSVRKGYERAYKEWMTKLPAILLNAPGFIGRDVIEPILPDRPYTIVLRFVSGSAMRDWLKTEEHRTLRLAAQNLLKNRERSMVASGLDLWIDLQPSAKGYRGLLMLFAIIFPITLLVPFLLGDLFGVVPSSLYGLVASGSLQTAIIGGLLSNEFRPRIIDQLHRLLSVSLGWERGDRLKDY